MKERLCLWCGEDINPDFHGNAKYCSDTCQSKSHYKRSKNKGLWDKRYKETKRDHRRSAAKRLGISIHQFMKLPADLRKGKFE